MQLVSETLGDTKMVEFVLKFIDPTGEQQIWF